MDRVGRMLIDLAPHIAMLGSDLGDILPILGNLTAMSTATQNGSTQSCTNLGLFDRFQGN